VPAFFKEGMLSKALMEKFIFKMGDETTKKWNNN
jgi:hypothetical protein